MLLSTKRFVQRRRENLQSYLSRDFNQENVLVTESRYPCRRQLAACGHPSAGKYFPCNDIYDCPYCCRYNYSEKAQELRRRIGPDDWGVMLSVNVPLVHETQSVSDKLAFLHYVRRYNSSASYVAKTEQRHNLIHFHFFFINLNQSLSDLRTWWLRRYDMSLRDNSHGRTHVIHRRTGKDQGLCEYAVAVKMKNGKSQLPSREKGHLPFVYLIRRNLKLLELTPGPVLASSPWPRWNLDADGHLMLIRESKPIVFDKVHPVNPAATRWAFEVVGPFRIGRIINNF